eukprot:273429_1
MASFSSGYSDYLIVTGGDNVNSTQIYDITNDLWLSNVADMQNPRSRHSCVVVDQRVYAIGGGDTVEVLNVANMGSIGSQTWSVMAASLPWDKFETSAVVFGSDIVLLGGSVYENPANKKVVVVIHTVTGTIASSSTPLLYAAAGISGVYAHPKLYAFGGYFLNTTTGAGTAKTEWEYASVASAIHNYDKPTNIYPSSEGISQATINIRSTRSSSDEWYYARFNVVNGNCTNPRVTMDGLMGDTLDGLYVSFYRPDYSTGPYSMLLAYCKSKITGCFGDPDASAGTCFTNKLLADNFHVAGSQIEINMRKRDNSPGECVDDLSLAADITLTCEPTAPPTGEPTVAPSNPTDDPTASPVTSGPTASPVTSDPTASPVTSDPTAATSTPTASPVNTCDADDSLDRVDCVEEYPSGQCSVLMKIAYAVCYVEPYMNQRSTLWTNTKACACSDVFDGST